MELLTVKKLWQQTAPLVLASFICAAGAGGWKLIWEEIKFHHQVDERLTAIEAKLGIQTQKSYAKSDN